MIDVRPVSDTSERVFSLQRQTPGKENESVFNEQWPICLGLTVPSVISNVELHLSELIGTVSHPDMQKIRTVGFNYKNRLRWQFKFRLLLFIICKAI
jgi:hypothetical protein